MATELKPTLSENGEVCCRLTRHSGGINRGVCVQITPEYGEGYTTLTRQEALDLAVALVQFANGTREEDHDY